ncbi:WXG100 family type VII secretion target [Corynebacterium breve]|uniref:ESAT-6-like protein n=1 Tax=Corynebacterium breve TaxID=3049799 RepID=A0ABY8VHM5_9CORY|nr:WXG100 family type VII secretion target [Corynebacterium breve]WIM68138.1 WXG100 family type VII secretion target [Corynebacterium breve]
MTQPTGEFQTEADVMRAAADHTRVVHDAVQSELRRLQEAIMETQSFWKGEAKSTFDDLMVRYDDEEAKLLKALTDIGNNIDSNAGDFEGVEAINADAFKAINPAEGLPL